MPKKRSYHVPQGDPCRLCRRSFFSHRVDHKFQTPTFSSGCGLCGLPKNSHRIRKARVKPKQTVERKPTFTYLGLDGEGLTDPDGNHRYVLLGCADKTGKHRFALRADDGGRLSTLECFEFLFRLPHHRVKLFSYSFQYDITKMLEDIDSERLWLLVRPEERARTGKDAIKGPWPVRWRGYSINLQSTKLTITRRSDKRRIVIWDIFKFFGCKFVTACTDWQVGTKDQLAEMQMMKEKRGALDKETPQAVEDYCLGECQCIADLAERLTLAHEDAGLKLKSYFGAGSSGSAMLDLMNVRDFKDDVPVRMRRAVACAFSGGRFEHSVIGAFKEELWSYDISSAYPYQTFFLPCLLHGTWRKTKREKDVINAKHALVSYSLPKEPKNKDYSWGPFPFRDIDGSISYPIESGGGWVWREEYLEGKKVFPHVKFEEAWIYEAQCEHQPFSKIPEYYLYRIKIGKEGAGLVIKLAINSCYGKLAQSVGTAIYNSWIWAGLITSGCRAQILKLMGLHKDQSNLLMIATDGIYTRERFIVGAPCEVPWNGTEVSVEVPKDTGTFKNVTDNKGKTHYKPLGGWEEKAIPGGVFAARPGIYFPLNPTPEQLKEIRGRGVGKGTILRFHDLILNTWEEKGLQGIVKISDTDRRDENAPQFTTFRGAKTSIHRSGKPGAYEYNRAEYYGKWLPRRVELSFDPMPKRDRVKDDGVSLVLRRFPGRRSEPYVNAIKSEEARKLIAAKEELLEQPDPDFMNDFEEVEG